MRALTRSGALSILVSLAPALAAAEAPSGRAEALFLEGREALKRGDSAAACARFGESHTLDPSAPGPALNLAECSAQRGRLVEARALFEEVARTLPAEDPRRAFATQRAAAAGARVATLSIVVKRGDRSDARVSLDGAYDAALSSGRPVAADPGRHRVDVWVGTDSHRQMDVELAEGRAREIVLDFVVQPTVADPRSGRPGASTAATPVIPTPGESGWRAVGYGLGSLGIAAVATGVTAGVLSLDRGRTYREECGATGCTDAGLRAAEEGRTFNLVTNVAAVTAVVAVGVSVYLLLRPSAAARSGRPLAAGGTW